MSGVNIWFGSFRQRQIMLSADFSPEKSIALSLPVSRTEDLSSNSRHSSLGRCGGRGGEGVVGVEVALSKYTESGWKYRHTNGGHRP